MDETGRIDLKDFLLITAQDAARRLTWLLEKVRTVDLQRGGDRTEQVGGDVGQPPFQLGKITDRQAGLLRQVFQGQFIVQAKFADLLPDRFCHEFHLLNFTIKCIVSLICGKKKN